MEIETYDRVYFVTRRIPLKEDREMYICFDRDENIQYAIVRLKGKDIINRILKFISTEKNNESFIDLKDFFIYRGDLHIAFLYGRGISLKKYLSRNLSMEERIEIGRNILEKIVLFNMSPYFTCQCLKPENIMVGESHKILFEYKLEEIEDCEKFTWQDISEAYCNILWLLFDKELRNSEGFPMSALVEGILKEEIKGGLNILREYENICERIKGSDREEESKKEKGILRIWEKVFGFHKAIEKIILIIIFAAVFAYMVYCIYSLFLPKEYSKNFESIGTVEIRD